VLKFYSDEVAEGANTCSRNGSEIVKNLTIKNKKNFSKNVDNECGMWYYNIKERARPKSKGE
jgi:hypothetical protein